MPSSSADAHRRAAPSAVTCFVLSISDTRTEDTDEGGKLIVALLDKAGHKISGYRLVRDEPATVRAIVSEVLAAGTAQVIVTTGGTGISRRDSTYEAIADLIEKHLVGFGELFRSLSFQEIGAAAMLSRATAGTVGRQAIFVLPGSVHAVELAMTKLIVPELGHVARELNK